MPGIAGIVDLKGRDLTGPLARMLGCLKSEDWHEVDSYGEPGFGIGRVSLGVVNPGPQPVFNSDRTLSLCMSGEIYHYPEELAKLYESPSGRLPDGDARRVLYLIERLGIEVVGRLNGAFALALWDRASRTLVLANDRFGLKPIYYFHENNFFAFASEVKSLLVLPENDRATDFQAVAEFLSLEFALGNKTFFKKTKVLEPGAILSVNETGLRVLRYWTPEMARKESSFHRDEATEKARFLLCQALKRTVRDKEKVTLALSGGLDSRLLVAAAVQAGRPVSTFTFGRRGCPDAKIAEAVARSLGVGNLFFEISPDYPVRWAHRGVWRTDGMNNCTNFAGIEVMPEVGTSFKLVLNGYGGNELWGGVSPGLVPFAFINDFDRLARKFFKRLCTAFGEHEQAELFQSDFYHAIPGGIYESFREIFARFSNSSSLGRLYRFWVEEKNRKCSLMGLVVDGDQVDYRAPFFDYDLADFLLSVPPRLKLFGTLKRRLLAVHFPRAAAVPYQKTDLPADAGLFRIFLKRGWLEAGKRLFATKESPPRGFADNAGWMRREQKDFVVSNLLSRRAVARGYFRKEYVEKLLNLHLSGKRDNSSRLGVLLTFELWNQLFRDGTSETFGCRPG